MNMRKHIDQLLREGKEEEAVPLIEEVWRKEKEKEQRKIKDITKQIEDIKRVINCQLDALASKK